MKKRLAVLIGALLILCISFTSTVAVFEIDVYWGLIDNDTLTTLNETWNVSIGKNETTTDKLYVNGTSYFNGDMTINGILSGAILSSYAGNNITWDAINKEFDVSLINGNGGFWNRSDNTLYTAIDNDNVQINGSLNVCKTILMDYYRIITIDSDYIDSELTNFPILLSIDDAIGDKCQSAGQDIIFILPNNLTILNHEIEKWVDNEDRIVWVNIPIIYFDVDTVFLMYYGNADVSDSQNPSGVWDLNYLGVYHLKESAGTACFDSTSNDNNGIYEDNLPSISTGKIGYGQDFDGNLDCISFPVGVFTPIRATVEFWFKADTTTDKTYFHMRYDADNHIGLFITNSDVYRGYGKWGGTVYFDIQGGTQTTNWEMWELAFQTNDAILNINSTTIGTDVSVSPISFGYTFIRIGVNTTSTPDGIYDEVRISNIRRSNAWLNASFDSQNQTTGFLNFGSEQNANTFTIDVLKVNDKEISILKQVILYNDARVKRHVRVTAPSWKMGVTAPTENQIGIFPVYSFDKNGDDIVYYSLIIPYTIETGSQIAVNIDWCYTGANDVGTVHWNLTYITVGEGELIDGTVSYIKQTSTGNHVSGTLVNTYLTGNIIGAIAHNILGLKLIRDTSEDTLDTDAHMIQVHFEFIEDKLGEQI